MAPAAPPITLHHALLGLLARRPLSGYEILKRFSRSIVFFWNAKRSQIYAELKRMERLGLVSSRLTIQQRRPNKRHYALTPVGRAALRAWLDTPTPIAPIKDEMLLRTFFADLLAPARAALHVRRHGEQHRRVLAQFEAIRASLEARYGPPGATGDRALFHGYLVLEQGIRFERMYAEWCEWAAEQIDRRHGRSGRPAEGPSATDFIMVS